jgi:hypothetical protein
LATSGYIDGYMEGARMTQVRITLRSEPRITSGNGHGVIHLDATTTIEASPFDAARLRPLASCAIELSDRLEKYDPQHGGHPHTLAGECVT